MLFISPPAIPISWLGDSESRHRDFRIVGYFKYKENGFMILRCMHTGLMKGITGILSSMGYISVHLRPTVK
jgi:hypothetical protein